MSQVIRSGVNVSESDGRLTGASGDQEWREEAVLRAHPVPEAAAPAAAPAAAQGQTGQTQRARQ